MLFWQFERALVALAFVKRRPLYRGINRRIYVFTAGTKKWALYRSGRFGEVPVSAGRSHYILNWTRSSGLKYISFQIGNFGCLWVSSNYLLLLSFLFLFYFIFYCCSFKTTTIVFLKFLRPKLILKGLSHGILSYFEHRQNYRSIEENLKMTLNKDRKISKR